MRFFTFCGIIFLEVIVMVKKYNRALIKQMVLFGEYWPEVNKYAQGCFIGNSIWGERIWATYLNRMNLQTTKEKLAAGEKMPKLFITFTEVIRKRSSHGGKQYEELQKFVDQNSTSHMIEDTATSRVVIEEEDMDGKKRWITYPLWSELEYDEKRPDGFFVTGNERLMKYLCDIVGSQETPFTLYGETEMHSLQTSNGFKLYHFLKPYCYKNQVVIPLSELRHKLRLPKSYDKNTLLWKYFLLPAMQDINSGSSHTDYSVMLKLDYRPELGGRQGKMNALFVKFGDSPDELKSYAQKRLF